jgi:hypothetical protein
LGFQLGLLGGDILLKSVGHGSAAFHDTTSCIRVLTVGFAKSDPNMQIPWGLFPCEQFINPARRRPPGTVFLRGD